MDKKMKLYREIIKLLMLLGVLYMICTNQMEKAIFGILFVIYLQGEK